MPCLAKECFWPLIASLSPEVKINHAHVTTQRILIKFIDEISYMVYGLAVMSSIPSWLLLIRWDSPLAVFRQSFGTLCAVFMGSLDGLQAVLESLQAVFRMSQGVFVLSLGILWVFWGGLVLLFR